MNTTPTTPPPDIDAGPVMDFFATVGTGTADVVQTIASDSIGAVVIGFLVSVLVIAALIASVRGGRRRYR